MAVLVDLQRRTMEDWQQGHSTDVVGRFPLLHTASETQP